MSAIDYSDYLEEYRSEGIGPKLYQLIMDFVSTMVRKYPPDMYSPNSVWDEDAIGAICHDFMLVTLIQRGQLEYDLLANVTSSGLRNALIRDLQRFLVSTRRRSEYLNLYTRVRRILSSESRFEAIGAGAHSGRTWGLSGWLEKEHCQDLNEVISAMFRVSLPPLVKYRADSRKFSHVIATPDLSDLLHATFVTLDRWTTLDLLMAGIRYRLGLLEAPPLSLDDPISFEDDDSATYAEIVPDTSIPAPVFPVAEMAEDIFQMLTDRQRQILAMRFASGEMSMEEIAERIGVGRSTVYNDQTAIARHLRRADIDEAHAEAVLAQLAELCESELRLE